MENIEVKKYPAYKDSGVQWLREIPIHWEVLKGKWLFIKQDRPARIEDEIITCFRNGEVTLRTNRKTEGFTIALKEHGYQGIRKGDLVIHNMDAFAGAIGISDSDGKSTPVYSVCTPRIPNRVNPYYYSYFLKDLAKSGFIESLAKGIRERSTDFRFNDFGLLLLSVPPLSEQTAIAAFLDRKVTLIDQAINIKQKQIELLKERRQILIHKAVTRGLNPNVKLKDSGVEWIGEIPEGWEVKKVKHFGGIKSGESVVNSLLNDSGRYEVYGGNGNMGFHNKYNVEGFKIIIGRVGAYCGNVRLINEKKWISDNALILTLNDESFYTYLAMLLEIGNLNNLNRSNAQPLITGSKVLNFQLPIPSKNEQQEILVFINKLDIKIATANSLKVQEIEKLKEYKATLINSAVTGKIKVM